MYWTEFATVALVHLLAVASPGPDFAVVLRNGVTQGRQAAMLTSIGVGCAIFIHVLYSVLGIGLIVANSLWLFNLVKLVGAGYLIYIGIMSLRAGARSQQDIELDGGNAMTSRQAFINGFLTNGTNPKALLFFLSLFSVVISHDTPIAVQFAYGVYMMVATALWFMLLSYLLTTQRVRRQFLKVGHWFERTMGLALLGLGIRLLFSGHK